MHVEVPQEQIETFCRKWKIREFGSLVRDDSTGEIRVRVEFDADADHSLLDHVRMERDVGAFLGATVRVIEKDALDYPLFGIPEEQADADLAYVLLMRSALERVVRHVVGLQGETYEQVRSLQDSTVRQLIFVAELVARVSPPFRSTHPEVPWADLVDLRTLLVHPYDRATPARAWQTIARDLPELGAALDHISGIEPAGAGAYNVSISFSGLA